MKQYLLRGIGLGIIFTSLVLLIAFGGTGKPAPALSEDEIISKAQELGMITQEKYLNKTFSDSKILELAKELGMYTSDEYDNKSLSEEEIIEKAKSLGMDFVGNSEQNNIDEEQTATDSKSEFVTIVVSKGMDSMTISKLLKKNQVIDDWAAFDKYLHQNKLTGVLRIGSYVIEKGSDYETIVKILTKK